MRKLPTLDRLESCPITKIVACMETELLSKSEAMLLQTFVTFVDNKTNSGHPSIEMLMNRSRLGKNTFLSAHKTLKEKGIVIVLKKGSSYSRESSEYRIDLSKLTDCYEAAEEAIQPTPEPTIEEDVMTNQPTPEVMPLSVPQTAPVRTSPTIHTNTRTTSNVQSQTIERAPTPANFIGDRYSSVSSFGDLFGITPENTRLPF